VIVADAGWIIALRDPGDPHHSEAAASIAAAADEVMLLHPVTLAECLLGPAKLGALDQATGALRAAFEITERDADAPVRWAKLRAETGLRLPDVIVLDTAIHHGARAIATFNNRLVAVAADRAIGPAPGHDQ
jgi:predicted nucleic acid-binding protein